MADVASEPIVAIADNLRRVRERIANAAIKAGRRPEDVTLVAVSKTKPIEAVRAALAAGQTVFGENRVQEAATKFPPLRAEHRFQLHIIGGLQTNKARDAVRLADVIETLDRPRLADAIAAAMEKEGRTPTLLIEVNTGDEPQKSGVARADADGFIEECKARFGAALVGLMCVPPLDQDPRPHFEWLAETGGAAPAGRAVDGDVGGLRDRDRLRRDLGTGRQRDLRASLAGRDAGSATTCRTTTRASISHPARSASSNRASTGLSRSSTPSSVSPFSSGTTSSDRDAVSQAMWPGNASTSGTRTDRRCAAAVPQTPLPSAMRTQAGRPWNGPNTSSLPRRK